MKKLICGLLMSILPFAANAEWVAGVGLFSLSADEADISVDLNAITVSAGYRFGNESDFSIMPQVRLGAGLGHDTLIPGFDVEIDSLLALSVRGQYESDFGMFLFAAPAYTNLDVKASGGGLSVSEDDWEFGVGGGIGFRFSDEFSAQLSYERYDDTDVLGIELQVWRVR